MRQAVVIMVKSSPLMTSQTQDPRRTIRQASRDERRPSGDNSQAPGAAGLRWGLSGEQRRRLLLTWLAAMVLTVMIIAINIMTRSHDHPDQPVGQIALWEGSSAVSLAFAFAIPAAVALWLHRAKPSRWLQGPVHLFAAVAFCIVHVGGFVAIRMSAAGLAGGGYVFGPLARESAYEFGKDLLTYGAVTTGFWIVLGRMPVRAPETQPVVFDIRDGQRLVRAPVAEILAVRSAANYAEFLLRDGRRPLMRTSLGALEDRLAAHGFVRTHRSCLVNASRVTGLRPEGSGDYTVELGAIEVPLSRRFRGALERLRP